MFALPHQRCSIGDTGTTKPFCVASVRTTGISCEPATGILLRTSRAAARKEFSIQQSSTLCDAIRFASNATLRGSFNRPLRQKLAQFRPGELLTDTPHISFMPAPLKPVLGQ